MTIVCNGGNIRSSGENLTVPTKISRMQHIQNEIKLAGRELTSLPDCVRQNVQLKILDLSYNFLGRTGDGSLCELSELRNLTRLNLSVNELKTIALDFCSFPFLEVLCLSGNELEYLSEGIVTLHRLRRLLCDFNHIKCLPLDWSMLISLTTLSLSNNHLEEIPTTIWTLQNLEILNLQRNRISTIGPLPEGAACRLKELRLAANRLSGSLDLSLLVNLTYLDVSHNDLEDIEVSKLSKLEYLVASQNVLKSLNLDGAKLRSLEVDRNGR
ncbi:leucine-rich repeat-containing protein 40-like [Stegodyphus dumicola]|uniref:leucine-rich repeat-containing protein 40-like n=1 Tax=Stegodyphus dumicola TaxID=202533 RepID=UPI0015AE5BD6|nr:leucine-rich repeat-containing protein 40-like [Stegodyphus dumicola]